MASCSSDDSNNNFTDSDNDGIEDVLDNCLETSNPNQGDSDNDGIGDECDEDDDNDGVLDINDNCSLIGNTNQLDDDGNGIGNVCDEEHSINKIICQNGFAGNYPCNDYDLLLHFDLNVLNASSANDSWGWTDTSTGNEYAIIGLNNGSAFVDITDTENPIYLGKLPTATANSGWRDIKVYNDHAFIVSEADNHGMQIFDLTRLRNVSNPPESFTADTHFTEFGSAHNMVINEETGYGYPVGTDRNGIYRGGPIFINIQDPKNPVSEGGWGTDDYSHDAQVVTYIGPDTDYIGKEILIGSNENEIAIVDITDKENPTNISTISYPNVRYTHQGWFTEDQTYFLLGDELDEQNFGGTTKTIIFDFTDLDNPKQHFTYNGPTDAIDHNGYVKDDVFYLANYTAGVRFIDVSNISNSTITEIGYFDTFPNHDNANFSGVWNVYPYLESGKIIISDSNSGLFIVKKSE